MTREDVARAREQLQAELAQFEVDANADLAALLCRELRDCAARYEEEKAKAGALDFLDLLLKARHLVAQDEDVRRSFQERFTRIFVDEFQDTDPLQAEILLLLAPTILPFRTGARSARSQASSSSSAIRNSRFIASAAPMSASIATFTTCSKRPAAERVTLRTSFRARPNIQRTINAAFEPV